MCLGYGERKKDRKAGVKRSVPPSSQSSDVLSLANDACVLLSINVYITDRVEGMIHVVCALYVSMDGLLRW